MAEKTRTELDAYFETADTPTETEFGHLIDSIPNFQDDGNYYGKEINITAFAGGGQANAYELSKKVNVVTICANGNDSVKLPTGNIVRVFTLFNNTVNTVDVYPPVGGFIDNLAVNIPDPVIAQEKRMYVNYDTGKWYFVK